jgi:hypothetical protein
MIYLGLPQASACELDAEMRFLEADGVRMKQNEGLRDQLIEKYSASQSYLHGARLQARIGS